MPLARSVSTIAAGDKVPSASVSVVSHNGEKFQDDAVDIAQYVSGKKVVIVGYPGAFTQNNRDLHRHSHAGLYRPSRGHQGRGRG